MSADRGQQQHMPGDLPKLSEMGAAPITNAWSLATGGPGEVYTTKVVLRETQCPNCGIVFALPFIADMERRKGSRWTTLYCPSGHQFAYTDTEVGTLKRERDAERSARVAAEKTAAEKIEEATRERRFRSNLEDRVQADYDERRKLRGRIRALSAELRGKGRKAGR